MGFFHPSNIITNPERDNNPDSLVRETGSVPAERTRSVQAPTNLVRETSRVPAERTRSIQPPTNLVKQSSQVPDERTRDFVNPEDMTTVQEKPTEQPEKVVRMISRKSSLAQKEEEKLRIEQMQAETGQPYKVPDLLNHSGDDNGTLFTSGTGGWTIGTQTLSTGTWTLGGTTIGADTILRTNGVDYVKQKYGIASVVVSVLQLFFLTTILSLCGLAPFMVNPAIGPYPDALSALGAKNSYLITQDHEYWRFLIAPFTNSSVLHLLFNLAVQLEAGAFFEREWGTPYWICIYISSSFGSTICSTILNPDSVTVGRFELNIPFDQSSNHLIFCSHFPQLLFCITHSTGALIGLFG